MRNELDTVLSVLGNSVRRKIIKRLSKESSYPLELSSDISVNQQLISKHLKVMEEADLVEAEKVSSPYGPERRVYRLTKSMSVTLDIAPDLYSARISFLNSIPPNSRIHEKEELEYRLNSLSMRKNETIDQYSDLIAEIDMKIGKLDKERTMLLGFRNKVMREAKESLQEQNISLREKMVIYHYLDKNKKDVNEISKSLDIRRERVLHILGRLRDESIIQ
jgi:predicted transcriptional regulator